jgi:hypothetical protein
MSNTSRGNYFKSKTKKYFQAKGYTCEYIETYATYWNPATRSRGFIKRDNFASDGIAMNNQEIIFWNSVLNRKNISEHVKRYLEFTWPASPAIRRMVIVWEPRKKEPELIEVNLNNLKSSK